MYRSLLLFALFLIFSCADNPTTINITALTGATLYDGNGKRVENAVVLIENDRIKTVGESATEIPEGAQVVDLKGKFITPGLVDAHIHFFQTAFFDARPDALNLRDSLPYEEVYEYQMTKPERYFEAYLRSGVTAVYDVGEFNAAFAFAKAAEEDSLAPHIATAGPLLTPAPEERIQGFNVEEDTVMIHLDSPETGIDHVQRNTARGATGIKIWGLAPQDSVFMNSLKATVEAVKEEGNRLIVHATTLEQAKAALKLGAALLVHSVQDTIVDQEFLDLAKTNNTYYNPTLIVGSGYFRTYSAVMGDGFEINDPNRVVDDKTKELLEGAAAFKAMVTDTVRMRQQMGAMTERLDQQRTTMLTNLKKVYDAGIPIVVGTDAGNPGTLHGISIYDEMEAMQAAGIPAKDLIVMATKNGAEIMRRDEDFGTLENGKLADLIILDKDPGTDIANMRSITHFMRAGNLREVTEPFGEEE